MTKTFTINGVDIIVNYNENIYTEKDIKNFLERASKSEEKFAEWTTEFEVVNYFDVINQLFRTGKPTEQIKIDLSDYMNLCRFLGQSIDIMLDKSFGITIVENHGNDIYTVEGPSKNIKKLVSVVGKNKIL